ncbi:MAG: hydroxyisourate hydrolase [Pseudolabrys sp.]
MARLTTHVLDTVSGRPAAGVRIVLRRNGEPAALADVRTNADGRLDRPLLEGSAFLSGRYELSFHVGDYFRGRDESLADPPFIDVIPVQVVLSDAADYHVPLLVSRYGYSVYRGS